MTVLYKFLLSIAVFYCSFDINGQDIGPKFSDLYFEYQFALLDKKTPLELDYNPLVRKHIERYLLEKPAELSKFLALSKYYFPIFEQFLDKYNLPLELKYLSVVESGLDPTAKSSSGAIGLWQFLLHSAQMFDLEVTSYIDERRDIYKSTEAACRYFQYLYQTFNNWHLVLAAYNGGPGVVRNAIERSGGKTGLWEIMPYLPEQTQNYVPSFLAMNYIMHNANEHNLLPSDTIIPLLHTDTLVINYQVTFQQIAKNIDISIETLRLLNPVYKLNIIPETGKPNHLILPEKLIIPYLRMANSIITDSLTTAKLARNAKLLYTVKKGDFLHKIAVKFGCNPQEIREWNKLKSDFIAPGQSLVIWVTK